MRRTLSKIYPQKHAIFIQDMGFLCQSRTTKAYFRWGRLKNRDNARFTFEPETLNLNLR